MLNAVYILLRVLYSLLNCLKISCNGQNGISPVGGEMNGKERRAEERSKSI